MKTHHHPRRRSVTAIVILFLVAIATRSAAQQTPATPLFATGISEEAIGMALVGDTLWIATKDNSLFTFNINSGQLLNATNPAIPGLTDWHLHGLATAGDGRFWTYDMISDVLYELRPGSGIAIPVWINPDPMPYGMTYHDGLLWIGHHSNGLTTPLHIFDPVTNQVNGILWPGAFDIHGMVWRDDHLFMLDNMTKELHQYGLSTQLRSSTPIATLDYNAMCGAGTGFIVESLGIVYRLETLDLDMSPLVSGQTVTLNARNAPTGSSIFYFASLTGTGEGPGTALAPSFGLDMAGPVFPIGGGTADLFGIDDLTLSLPILPAGISVWTQAILCTSAAPSDCRKSNVAFGTTL